METSTGAPHQPGATAPMQQHSSLIRTDQVQKLPHLTDAQKTTHTQVVRSLWETLNAHTAGSTEFANAQSKLNQISQSLMKGMKIFQQSRQQQQHIQQQQQQLQQQQAQQQQQQQQQAQMSNQQQQQAQMNRPAVSNAVNPTAQPRPQMGLPQTFQQLLPQIQTKVNSLTFTLPPTIAKEQSEGWMQEARLRYGLALQKQEVGRVKLAELRQQYAQRQSAGPLTPEEMQEIKTRQLSADKLFREGSDFLTKFKEQQESFRVQHQSQQLAGRPNVQNVPVQGQVTTSMQQPSTSAPAPHTVNSAVVAARSQPVQAPQAQGQAPGGTTQPQPQQPVTAAQTIPQNAFNQQAQENPQLTSQISTTQGPPRPLSQQAAMAQAAQNYSNMSQQPASQPATTHAHPQNYVSGRTDTRNVTMSIPKTLSVATPEPINMGPSRPTLTAGPSHGATGVMGQPAIQKHPGYVLEGEGQHVLSKKMLDVLVKQVTGGGEGEGLTPDAEDFILQMADDFVDEVITAACRLAKLRPSASLEIRDIQLVLERNYNMRLPGFSADDLRTVKKPHPTQGWIQKMSAVQAAKVTQGRSD